MKPQITQITQIYNKKLLQGVQGGMLHVFSKRAPLAAGGKGRHD